MAIAVVDPAGTLVYFEKADNTQLGSARVAIDKARSAALFKRPTKVFQDNVEKGGVGVRVLRLAGAVPLEGGVPLRRWEAAHLPADPRRQHGVAGPETPRMLVATRSLHGCAQTLRSCVVAGHFGTGKGQPRWATCSNPVP
jgi:hypothetical protein